MALLVYLGGDSYPKEPRLEETLAQPLARTLGMRFAAQSELICTDQLQDGSWKDIPTRLMQTRQWIDTAPEREIVLVGRSSGGRIATLLDGHPKVSAIVCLAYPFRAPGQPVETERFDHLSRIHTPTLIIQGKKDKYGGRKVKREYALSPHIRLRLLETDHNFKMPPAQLEVARHMAETFLRRKRRRRTILGRLTQLLSNGAHDAYRLYRRIWAAGARR